MTDNNIAVSVIMPTYNRADLIGRSIKSVLRQTMPDFELIIIDDASTDNTEEVVRSFEDDRIVYIRLEENHLQVHKETGMGDNPRNVGLRRARGRYIGYLDSDDMYRVNFMEEMVKFMDQNPDLGLAYCDAYWHRNLDGKGELSNCNLSIEFGPKIMTIRNIIRTPTVLHTKEAGEKVGFFAPIKTRVPHEGVPYVGPEDWDYWLRISKHYKVKHHAVILVHKINETSDYYNDPDFDPEFQTPEPPPIQVLPESKDIFHKMSTAYEFVQLFEKLKHIEGWLNMTDGYVLHLLAKAGRGSGEIVEVGSFLGLSTCWLALGAKAAGREKITAVDHFQGSAEHQKGAKAECKVLVKQGTTFNQFQENLKSVDVDDYVNPIRASSTEAAKTWDKPIRLLFLDGGHEYESVKADWEAWSSFIIPGGYVAFHDVDTWPEVSKFYYEMLDQNPEYKPVMAVHSLRIVQKAMD
ncbi:glycosyltransferase [Desulfatibacillum aliphaticivorans]|uniref:glycosyltransferase n=1 Tax=Desulfatibacillum aliphaticivorans TaxID=218208 RepID=UPI00042A3913|nr:glycosyltransferase [Desulfatibacillum aliphaticivorans]